MKRKHGTRRPGGWTLLEILVTVAVVAVLAAIAFPVMTSFKKRANRERALEKLRSLGVALVSYTSEHSGELPWEDAPGGDDWQAVSDPANKDVWYNALPELMSAGSAASMVSDPRRFYEDTYPLYIPGAPYPGGNKKLGTPYFALAMNSRLQRKNDEGIKLRGTLAAIQAPQRTVIFLERGMPGDKKSNPGQRGFDASPKANPRAFVARHNGRGLLVFADGHVQACEVSDLITSSGQIKYPQTDVVWTNDPEDDPN